MEVSLSQQEALWLIIAGGGFIFFMAFSFVVAYNLYRKKITDQLVQAKQQEINHKTELLQAQIKGEDKERDWIATEIHDEIGSRLAILRLTLMNVLMKNQMEEAQESQLIFKTFDRLIESTQRISHGLKPPELEHAGLIEAVRGVIETLNVEGLDIEFTADDIAPEKWNSEVDISIYKIIFELIHNTLKHANASIISIQFKLEKDIFDLEYMDNGIGFNMDESYLNGLGLRSIVSRSQYLSGEYQFFSSSGNGFKFSLRSKY